MYAQTGTVFRCSGRGETEGAAGQREGKCISVYFLLEKGPVFLYNGYPYCDIHGKSLISLRKQYTIKKIVFLIGIYAAF